MNSTIPEIKKPIKAKPQFYACCLEPMQIIASKHGYNLVMHGSANRDLDLIAVPWVDNPSSHMELIHSLCEFLGVDKLDDPEHYMFSVLAGGRHSFVINLNRGEKFSHIDPQWYLDISITPLLNSNK